MNAGSRKTAENNERQRKTERNGGQAPRRPLNDIFTAEDAEIAEKGGRHRQAEKKG